MANTPKGYPYPVGTDRVADGDNVIQALAEKVDGSLGLAAGGLVTITPSGAGAATPIAVTFPAGRFTVAPWMVSNMSAGSNTDRQTGVTGVTTTGATITLTSATAAAVPVYWIALQV
jgi:hypothetical protein